MYLIYIFTCQYVSGVVPSGGAVRTKPCGRPLDLHLPRVHSIYVGTSYGHRSIMASFPLATDSFAPSTLTQVYASLLFLGYLFKHHY